MENISYVGLSQQMVLERKMDIVANNLANMNTPGYKGQSLLFLEYINKTDKGGTKSTGSGLIRQVMDYASYRDATQGSLTQTHNELDFAVNGEGFFAVNDGSGIKYTRAGNFSLNDKRQIVTKEGYPVMNDSNNPMEIQANATRISINPDGQITTDVGAVGKIKLVKFNNVQDLKPIGENLFDGTQLQEQPVENPSIKQGMIEGSNVNAIVEMNKMIQVLRSYQATQKMLSTDHERIRGAIQKLTRT